MFHTKTKTSNKLQKISCNLLFITYKVLVASYKLQLVDSLLFTEPKSSELQLQNKSSDNVMKNSFILITNIIFKHESEKHRL